MLVVEKYSKTTRFCFICNFVSKIIPALQSRCTRFRFGPLKDEAIIGKLDEVVRGEGLSLEKDAVTAIVALSGGDMRKVLNILESCSLAYKDIPVSKIYEVTGRPSPEDTNLIYTACTTESYGTAFEVFMTIKQQNSLSLDDIVRELHSKVMETQFTEQMKMFLVCRLSEVEFRLAKGANEKVQIASIVGAFIEVRNI